MTWVAVAVGGAAVVGSMVSSDASRSAANKQADAANNASQMQWDEFNKTQQNLQPYMDIGTKAINPMYQAMGYNMVGGNLVKDMANPLNQQFSFNPGDLTKTPGYQFALQQGMQGINNSAAAKGLGMSSANMRQAAQYATGLADQTYGDQYNRALQTYQTNYNSAANNAARMAGLVQTGQNSAAGVGNMGLQTAMNSGNLLTSGAAAQAAGTIGQANAINSGLGTMGNYMMTNQMMNRVFPQNGMYGGSGNQTWNGADLSGYNFQGE